MTSPDVSRYVDLTIYDTDPVTSLNDILTHARGVLPEWSPRAGNIETVLAEAIAVKSSELSAAINRVPSATVEVLLKLFGVERVDGTRATGQITITLSDSDVVPRTIPAGTEFIYYSPSRDASYTYTLDQNFSLSGTTSGVANVTAKAVGSEYNVNATGQNLIIVSGISFFESAVFSSSPSGGTNAESDSTYFDRAVALLGSYTSASTTASQIKAYVGTNKQYADRVEVYDRRRYRDRDTTGVSFTEHDGYVLVAVGGFVSTAASASFELPVSVADMAELYDSLEERTPAGLVVDVMSAELSEVDVDISVSIQDGYIASEVENSIVTALQAYLDPNVWDWGQQYVRRNEIIALVDSVEGVDFVADLSLNGRSVLGSDNIGYYANSGGTSASAVLDVTATSGYTIPEGTAYYYVYTADADNPIVYTYLSVGSWTATAGSATVPVVAADVGSAFNDESNLGNIPDSATYISTDSDAGSGTVTSGDAMSGGTDNILQFTALPVNGGVSTDILSRNLGSLVIYGNINVTIV